MAPSLLWEAFATLVFNFALTGVGACAALLKPLLPDADDVALVFALVMARRARPHTLRRRARVVRRVAGWLT
jgi:hypothetical protein